jgi:hypothetical protein
MSQVDKLREKTSLFFNRHWGLTSEAPEWDLSWNWDGPLTNLKLGGLYALFKGDKLLYVGLGASRGGGLYTDRGISRRLTNHVIRKAPKGGSTQYVTRKRWEELGVNRVGALALPADRTYLASSLEDFLIGDLNPPENKVKVRK